MQFSDLQARATLLVSLEGWSDISPTPNWANLVNQAWVEFAWDGECVYGAQTFNTVIGQTSYTLTGAFKRLTDVIYDYGGANTALLRSSDDYERYYRADWRTQASAVPVRYTYTPVSTINLVPPPLAVKSVQVRGVIEPALLVNPADVPPIPDYLHEGIALKAALLLARVYAQAEAAQRVQLWQQEYERYIQSALKFANSDQSGGPRS